MRLSDLQSKDIVNVIDGRNIGNIIDVKVEIRHGKFNHRPQRQRKDTTNDRPR